MVDIQHYISEQLSNAEVDTENIFSVLNASKINDPQGNVRSLSHEKMLMMLRKLFIGVLETTTKLLTEAMFLLAKKPDAFARIHKDTQFGRHVVEELIRLGSPAQNILHTPTIDVGLAGVSIPAGSRIFVMFAAAHRDPEVFRSAEQFDPDRTHLGQHFGFGRGSHLYVGDPLARREMQVALSSLSRRFLRPNVVPEQSVEYMSGFVLRGMTSLQLQFEAR